MNIFEKRKLSLLRKKIDLHRKKIHNKGKFSLFDTHFFNDNYNKETEYKKLEYIYEVIKEWDETCNLPYDVGIFLDNLTINNTIMIHRTNLKLNKHKNGLEYNDDLINIMKKGLKNFGHANAIGGGAFINVMPPLTLAMTPLDGLSGYINLVSQYKSNDTIIVVAFPKDIVNSDGEVNDNSNYSNIYDITDNIPTVKSDYLVGVILKKIEGLDEFYTRDQVLNILEENMNYTK